MISQKIAARAGLEAPTVDKIVLQVRTAQSVPYAGYMAGATTTSEAGVATAVRVPTLLK